MPRRRRCCGWSWRESTGTGRRSAGWRSPSAPRAGCRRRCGGSATTSTPGSFCSSFSSRSATSSVSSASFRPLAERAGIVAAMSGIDDDARHAEAELARHRESARCIGRGGSRRRQAAAPAAARRLDRAGGRGVGGASGRLGRSRHAHRRRRCGRVRETARDHWRRRDRQRCGAAARGAAVGGARPSWRALRSASITRRNGL